MSNVASILRQLMHSQHLSESELSRRTGIGQPVIHRIVSGQTVDPKVNTLRAIATYFCVSISQLIGDAPLTLVDNKKITVSKVPLIAWTDALYWPKNREKICLTSSLEYCLIAFATNPNVYSVKVKDTAMQPLFPKGALLVMDPDLRPEDQDYALIYMVKQQQIIFRQVLLDGQSIYLKLLNSELNCQSTVLAKSQENISYQFLSVLIQSRNAFKQDFCLPK